MTRKEFFDQLCETHKQVQLAQSDAREAWSYADSAMSKAEEAGEKARQANIMLTILIQDLYRDMKEKGEV